MMTVPRQKQKFAAIRMIQCRHQKNPEGPFLIACLICRSIKMKPDLAPEDLRYFVGMGRVSARRSRPVRFRLWGRDHSLMIRRAA